jgi:hypothetical protein
MSFDNFEDDFEGQPSKRPSNKATVPDGDYTVEVQSAELRDTKAGEVFSVKMTILDDGPLFSKQIEKAIFLVGKGETEQEKAENRKRRVGDMKADLATIGFDVDNWTRANGRPFGAQVGTACVLMIGCKLKVRAKTSNDYQNIYINKRLEDGKPAKFGKAEMVVESSGGDVLAGDAPPAQQPAAPPVEEPSQPIPF